MPCNGIKEEIPACIAGKCQCAKKSGGDSYENTVRTMKNRLSACLIEVPAEGEGVIHKGIHFGQAVQYVIKHFSVCLESARTHLKELHIERHLKLFPDIENPEYVILETVPVKKADD